MQFKKSFVCFILAAVLAATEARPIIPGGDISVAEPLRGRNLLAFDAVKACFLLALSASRVITEFCYSASTAIPVVLVPLERSRRVAMAILAIPALEAGAMSSLRRAATAILATPAPGAAATSSSRRVVTGIPVAPAPATGVTSSPPAATATLAVPALEDGGTWLPAATAILALPDQGAAGTSSSRRAATAIPVAPALVDGVSSPPAATATPAAPALEAAAI
ncbi:hypothetical protein PUNSTDRAFT_138759 [Punctularia strigosozonata HHB-11173 SS5]|uniref:Uncharacterized protein n=1 Tax=Punctularia strigosozonata (strain HHB-11173) TaxID=741275 RepID=R7S3I9_PUNST|nr:uncharacterized protein PUNSTDRAFT_138759 [Punctularia strigosozonata HHB-11173 SS5]EIN04362.1 hypothetical protein PUNSTDRAFT_138759 [Punctularia strigosozonata HHB-11173 SS5]